jgi:hypothetical protein
MTIKLNEKLLLDQGVPQSAEDALVVLHTLLDNIKSNPDEYGSPLQVLEVVKCMEYTMQSLWRFPLSSKHHIHQFYIEKCTCPKLDNRDRIGSGYFVYNKGCTYHGAMLKQNERECKLMGSMIL